MAGFDEGITLDRFLMETAREHPNATGFYRVFISAMAPRAMAAIA